MIPDPDLLVSYATLLALLALGVAAIWLAYHWYRSLKRPQSAAADALMQLNRTLEKQGDLGPDEIERIRAAVERQRKEIEAEVRDQESKSNLDS